MPDQLNKQSLINLLIDSPLREPIKINLIDIVNNTAEPDLPKVYSTITKELEIFQKATERRMKLAEETIAKLGGAATPTESSSPASMPTSSELTSVPTSSAPTGVQDSVVTGAPTSPALSVPPLDLPPLPQMPVAEPATQPTVPAVETPLPSADTMPATEPAVPSADLPPVAPPPAPNLTPLGSAPTTNNTSDEDALAEIQKELDSLKTTTANEISTAAAPAAEPVAPAAPVQQ